MGVFSDDGSQGGNINKPMRPEPQIGDFYYEDDTLNNMEPNQYMPVVCPFPDIKGFEVREDAAEVSSQMDSMKLESAAPKKESSSANEGTSKESAFKVKEEKDDPGIMQVKSSGAPVLFPHCSKPVQAMHAWFEEAKRHESKELQAKEQQQATEEVKEMDTKKEEEEEEEEDDDDVAMTTDGKVVAGGAGGVAGPSAGPTKSFAPLVLIQLPTHLPITPASAQAQMAKAQGMNPEDFNTPELPPVTTSSQKSFTSSADYTVRNIPPGQIGKLVFYKSGKVKLKVGGSLLDVSPGTGCLFDQEVVAVDTEEKGFHRLGSVNRRLVCSLDVQDILSVERSSKGKK